MPLAEKLKKAADQHRLKLGPLPEHCAAKQSEHVRMHYALALAALLKAQGTVTDAQSRLLLLLLDSLRLGDIRGALFEQGRDLQEEDLIEISNVLRGAGLARHLLVDAMVLLRLDQPLDDETSALVQELAALLGVDAGNLGTCARTAAGILGLGDSRSNAAVQKWPGYFQGLGKIPALASPRPQTAAKQAKSSSAKKRAAAWIFPSGAKPK